MDLGDRVVVDQPGHPHHRKTGRIVGRRGERAPGEIWYLVFIELNRRSFLFTGSMLRVIEEKKDEPDKDGIFR